MGIPESFALACRERRLVIESALGRSDETLSSIVEAAARDLHSAIPPHGFATQRTEILPDQSTNVTDDDIQVNVEVTNAGEICEYDFALKFERGIGVGHFDDVNLIRMEIGGQWKVFAAKDYRYEDGCEELGDVFLEALKEAFARIDHPCFAKVLYYQQPACARVQSLRLNIVRKVLLNHF
jgi:hypothetical protein